MSDRQIADLIAGAGSRGLTTREIVRSIEGDQNREILRAEAEYEAKLTKMLLKGAIARSVGNNESFWKVPIAR